MAKGGIAQFLFLSLCFKKLSAAEASESVYMRETVNLIAYQSIQDEMFAKLF